MRAETDLERGTLDVVDELEERFDDAEVCHLRDSAITGRFVSLCRVPPSGKVAVHRVVSDSIYCGGCGRPRCPDCLRLWRELGGAA